MIKGAIEVIGGIPAAYLDPLLIAESQSETMRGYIVIDYSPKPETKRYDVLFVSGTTIYECVTLDADSRDRVEIQEVRARFIKAKAGGTAVLCLFQAEEALTRPFIYTVHTKPTIKVSVDALTRKQVQRLVASADCRRALAERNDFTRKRPVIEFKEIDPSDTQLEFQIGFAHGGFLLYDLGEFRQTGDATPERDSRVLPATSPGEVPRVEGERGKKTDELTLFPEMSQTVRPAQEIPRLGIAGPPEHSQTIREEEGSELVGLFNRFVSSFRQMTLQHYGAKSESFIERSEKKVRLLTPEFSIGSLTPHTAPLVLDMVETMVKSAPVLKRSKFRGAALGLVSDLYNKNYALLERHKALERVEQIYYRMKK